MVIFNSYVKLPEGKLRSITKKYPKLFDSLKYLCIDRWIHNYMNYIQ